MKAVVIEKFKSTVVVKDVPIPTIEPDEILVKIFSSGVCHTDVHLADGDYADYNPPIIPGHEGAGVVEQIGLKVDTLKVGDRVGVYLINRTCGSCDLCLRGFEAICPRVQFIGTGPNGCYAEFVAVDHRYAVKLPDGLKFSQAASLMCAGLTVYRGILDSNTRPGSWFSVVGIGGLGHLAVQFAKAMGLQVVAVDISDEKLELAKELGADLVINSLKEDPVEKIQKEVQGVLGAIVCATAAVAFDQAVRMLRPCGTAVFVGLPSPGGQLPSLPIVDLIWGQKTIKGGNIGSRADLRECLQFGAKGKVRVHNDLVKMDQINDVFQLLHKGKVLGRVVMQIREEN